MNTPHLRIVDSTPAPREPKPRPGNMFQQGESKVAPKRDKLLFIEAMTASGELTLAELRVGIKLTTSYSPSRGFAYPSMQYIAHALSMDKRQVGRALKSLEAKGWFIVDHGTRGRGKNHVNKYLPNEEKVTGATPFYDAAKRESAYRSGGEKVTPERDKVTPEPIKGDCRVTQYVASLYDAKADTFLLRRTSSGDEVVTQDTPPDFVVLGKLQEIERRLKGSSFWVVMTPSERRRAARGWLETCEQIFEDYPPHEGHGNESTTPLAPSGRSSSADEFADCGDRRPSRSRRGPGRGAPAQNRASAVGARR